MAKHQVRITRHRTDFPKELSFKERVKLGQLNRLEKLEMKVQETLSNDHVHNETCNHE